MTGVRDLREFVVAVTPALSRTAYLLTGDHHLAQDLLQSALANTYRHWRRVRAGNPGAYVRKAMHHEQLSWWRRRRVPEVLLPETPQTRGGDHAEQADTRLWLWQALSRLTPRQRSPGHPTAGHWRSPSTPPRSPWSASRTAACAGCGRSVRRFKG